MIRNARRHIFISSLYIGETEHELVRPPPRMPPPSQALNTQIDTLSAALAANPELRLTLLLDRNRTTRPGAASPLALLLPLVGAHPERVHAALYRSPALKPPLAWLVPPRFDEGWGTWHAKVYGADDAVLLSGCGPPSPAARRR
jgi:CDP-diacylglycerol--glycerol-3-phosphate 3-phosphatidyltransferase